jgi:hypothetical protein
MIGKQLKSAHSIHAGAGPSEEILSLWGATYMICSQKELAFSTLTRIEIKA